MARSSFWIITLTGLFAASLWLLPRFMAPPLLGQIYLACAVAFCLLMATGAWFGSHHELLDAWTFALLLSFCLLLPDVLLARQSGLAFPNLGGPRIYGPLPAYLPVLWLAPLLVVLWLAEIAHRQSGSVATLVALLASAAMFAAMEWVAPRLSLWVPRGVYTVQGVAVAALAAKTLLGLAAWLMFTQVQHRTIFAKAAGAAAVSMFYAGALFASHLAFQRYF